MSELLTEEEALALAEKYGLVLAASERDTVIGFVRDIYKAGHDHDVFHLKHKKEKEHGNQE